MATSERLRGLLVLGAVLIFVSNIGMSTWLFGGPGSVFADDWKLFSKAQLNPHASAYGLAGRPMQSELRAQVRVGDEMQKYEWEKRQPLGYPKTGTPSFRLITWSGLLAVGAVTTTISTLWWTSRNRSGLFRDLRIPLAGLAITQWLAFAVSLETFTIFKDVFRYQHDDFELDAIRMWLTVHDVLLFAVIGIVLASSLLLYGVQTSYRGVIDKLAFGTGVMLLFSCGYFFGLSPAGLSLKVIAWLYVFSTSAALLLVVQTGLSNGVQRSQRSVDEMGTDPSFGSE